MNNAYTSSSTWSSIKPIKTTYHILGEDFEIEGATSIQMITLISTLNLLGRPFYNEVKKQGVNFDTELDEFIQKRLSVIERDLKIDKILD